MMKKGFYIRAYGKDCFIESTAKNRTNALALEFVNKIQNKLNRFSNIDNATIEHVRKNMQPATMEVKTIKNGAFAGLQYININGDSFSFGCDPCENPFNVCVIV